MDEATCDNASCSSVAAAGTKPYGEDEGARRRQRLGLLYWRAQFAISKKHKKGKKVLLRVQIKTFLVFI